MSSTAINFLCSFLQKQPTCGLNMKVYQHIIEVFAFQIENCKSSNVSNCIARFTFIAINHQVPTYQVYIRIMVKQYFSDPLCYCHSFKELFKKNVFSFLNL